MFDLKDRRVFVLDGELRSALAVTRSLGQSGAHVIVGSPTRNSLAGASKYARAQVMYARPEHHGDQFVSDVKRACAEHAVTDLIPTSEVAIGTLLRHRHELGSISLPLVEQSTYDLSVDKHRLVELAARLGMFAPKSRLCTDVDNIEETVAGFEFPVVLKPVRSRVFANGTWANSQVQYAFDLSDLRDKVRSHPQYAHPFMVQEYIKGEGKGVFLLYDRGREIARFSHRRIREKPPSGGVSVLSSSEKAPDELFAAATRLLDELRWHGVAMVEFKVTPQGVPYLMEINPRFWGSLQLAIDSGVDFPALLLAMRDRQLPSTRDFPEGVRLRWLLGDLDHLLIVLRSKAHSSRQKVQAVLSFLNFFSPRTRYETFRWKDPAPFATEMKLYLKALRGKQP